MASKQPAPAVDSKKDSSSQSAEIGASGTDSGPIRITITITTSAN